MPPNDATAFDSLLVANRGEIACRIIGTARAMGLRTVAVYSSDDRDARHVGLAHTAVRLDDSGPALAYRSIEALLEACRRSGAGALHPGYGFLAENATLARACEAAGIVFVGPPPAAIEQLGHKARAKRLAERIGIACLRGYHGEDQSADALSRAAARIGAPLMIKAAAGGGGRGLRRVDHLGRFAALAEAARNEAFAAFGDGTLMLEALAQGARHVEIQLLADRHGGCVHLGERDCTTQRRHQKLVEESPAPCVSLPLCAAMGAAAVRLAQAAGYVGAGTVEFLLLPDGEFRFLEVNTRLQVEHAVTEAITGIDLVEMQLRIARGERLECSQGALRFHGHAIEARLCAEDAWRGFAPQSGDIVSWRLPCTPGVRIEHALSAHATVSPRFDSMIAKLIAHGRDREEARRRLVAALRETSILGPKTNRAFLLACLEDPVFVEPRLHTGWLEAASRAWPLPLPGREWQAAAAACRVHVEARRHGALANWSSSGPRISLVSLATDDGRAWPAIVVASDRRYRVRVGADELDVEFESASLTIRAILVDGIRHTAHFAQRCSGADAFHGWLDLGGFAAGFFDAAAGPSQPRDDTRDGKVRAGMHGRIVAVHARPGQPVRAGQALVSIEAMKMEHRIEAPVSGRISLAHARAGAQVSPTTLLFEIEPCARGAQGPQDESDEYEVEAARPPMPSAGDPT